MAEGYITKPRDMSIEEVGWRYYNELINRSMIQPSEKARDSMAVERCRIHGVVLQIIMSKSIEENQLFIVDKHYNEAPQSKIRHLAVTKWKRDEEKMVSINLSQVRSLTIFGKCPPSLISSKLRLLRVLDLEDTVELGNDDLKYIGELLHLRYLGLRNTSISRLPSSLENLRYLETLDVQDTKVTQLPAGITKLEKLRYLVCGINFANDLVEKTRKNNGAGRYTSNLFKPLTVMVSRWRGASPSSSSIGEFSTVAAPKRIDKLRNLQALGMVHITQGSKVASNLGKLTCLRELGVDVDANEDVKKDLCSSVASLVRLERLEVRSESLEFLKDVKTPPKHLTALNLSGRLSSLPSWLISLNDLAKVKLIQTQLKRGDIEVIGNLLNLTLLALWEESFAEESLRFSKGTFQKLNLLYIEGLENVSTITIEDGALPLLENLQVTKCNNLHDREEGLSSVLSLEKLNELVLKSCGDKPELEKALQKQISGSKSVNRPKLIIGKSIVTKT
jgi:Leucine-rich repeat (LRR) protein